MKSQQNFPTTGAERTKNLFRGGRESQRVKDQSRTNRHAFNTRPTVSCWAATKQVKQRKTAWEWSNSCNYFVSYELQSIAFRIGTSIKICSRREKQNNVTFQFPCFLTDDMKAVSYFIRSMLFHFAIRPVSYRSNRDINIRSDIWTAKKKLVAWNPGG